MSRSVRASSASTRCAPRKPVAPVSNTVRSDAAGGAQARLAAGSGPWAANALFAQGRLEGDRGHLPEARRVLSAYLARFPRGRNAADFEIAHA